MLPKYKLVFAALTLTLGMVAAVTAGSATAKAAAPAAPAPAAAPAAGPSATPATSAQEAPVTASTIVYLAGAGSRYHTKDCKYLKKAGKPVAGKQITISDAMKQGYAPCNQCKAPRLPRN